MMKNSLECEDFYERDTVYQNLLGARFVSEAALGNISVLWTETSLYLFGFQAVLSLGAMSV